MRCKGRFPDHVSNGRGCSQPPRPIYRKSHIFTSMRVFLRFHLSTQWKSRHMQSNWILKVKMTTWDISKKQMDDNTDYRPERKFTKRTDAALFVKPFYWSGQKKNTISKSKQRKTVSLKCVGTRVLFQYCGSPKHKKMWFLYYGCKNSCVLYVLNINLVNVQRCEHRYTYQQNGAACFRKTVSQYANPSDIAVVK